MGRLIFWGSVAIGFYYATPYFIPIFIESLPPSNDYRGIWQHVLQQWSPVVRWAGVIPLLFAIRAALRRWKQSRFLSRNRTLKRIAQLDWREFEQLIEAYYREQGCRTFRDARDRPDGGVDVQVWNKNGEHLLVQCKHWKARPVGVKIVRELLGVVAKESASGGVVVTSSVFTREARDFARGVAIELIDRRDLAQMLH